MNKYHVTGLDRDNGKKRAATVRARSEDDAILKVGFVVEDVRQIDERNFSSKTLVIVLLASLAVGYVAGREHVKYEIRQKLMAAANAIQASFGQRVNTASGRDMPSMPSPVDYEIVDITTRPTEQNSSWWKYAWVLKVKNNGDKTLLFDATIQWLDADGFVVDDDSKYGLMVAAGETRTFQDYQLIDASVARNVASVNAKASPR